MSHDQQHPIQDYVSYALAAAHRQVSTSLNIRLKRHGMQIEAWRVLETLEARQSVSMGQLAEIVLLNPPTLTKLVDRMVSDGLVHRQIAQSDHRQVNVMVTALGQKRMMLIRQDVEEQDAALQQILGPQDTQRLLLLLNSLASPQS